nr:HAD hydrolase-like protein [Candidatus Aenigmarchaeota archaeon]
YLALKEAFEKMGVDDKLFSETLRKASGRFGFKPRKQIKMIAEELPEIKLEQLEAAFKKIIDGADKFLYPDVSLSLEELKKENELIMVSYGDKKYQNEKIKSSKVIPSFNKIIVTQELHKVSELKKILGDCEKAIFVEDNPHALTEAKKCFPKIITVRINRGEGRYAKTPDNEKIDFTIANMDEFKKILEKLER